MLRVLHSSAWSARSAWRSRSERTETILSDEIATIASLYLLFASQAQGKQKLWQPPVVLSEQKEGDIRHLPPLLFVFSRPLLFVTLLGPFSLSRHSR